MQANSHESAGEEQRRSPKARVDQKHHLTKHEVDACSRGLMAFDQTIDGDPAIQSPTEGLRQLPRW